MDWFRDAETTARWGGPEFRFPFTAESFIQACRWPDIASYVLVRNDSILGFGQFYARYEHIHFARIAVSPHHRRQGTGKQLMLTLMAQASKIMFAREFSLFVMRDNDAACSLYRSLGFQETDFPAGAPMQEICYYMTCPVI